MAFRETTDMADSEEVEWGGGGELRVQSSTEEFIPSKRGQGSNKEVPMDEPEAAVDLAATGKRLDAAVDLAASDDGELQPQHSTEELCKEAAQKLSEYHTASKQPDPIDTATDDTTDSTAPKRAAYSMSEVQSTPPPPIPSSSGVPPNIAPSPYTPFGANTPLQIPLKRGDAAISFHIPPPPPPSPGDALSVTRSQRQTASHDAREDPIFTYPYPFSALNPMMYPQSVPPYIVMAAPPQRMVCVQAPQQTQPPQSTNIENNMNVVVENNIGHQDHYPSYLCFSILMLLLCTFLNPLVLCCAIPALCCSCASRLSQSYDTRRMTAKCALTWNIITLVVGIFTFVLVILPAIIVPVILGAGLLLS